MKTNKKIKSIKLLLNDIHNNKIKDIKKSFEKILKNHTTKNMKSPLTKSITNNLTTKDKYGNNKKKKLTFNNKSINFNSNYFLPNSVNYNLGKNVNNSINNNTIFQKKKKEKKKTTSNLIGNILDNTVYYDKMKSLNKPKMKLKIISQTLKSKDIKNNLANISSKNHKRYFSNLNFDKKINKKINVKKLKEPISNYKLNNYKSEDKIINIELKDHRKTLDKKEYKSVDKGKLVKNIINKKLKDNVKINVYNKGHNNIILSKISIIKKIIEENNPLFNSFATNLGHKLSKYKGIGNISTSTSFYQFGKLLGKGNFGDVYLGKHIMSNADVAIKVINKKQLVINDMHEKINQEIESMFMCFNCNYVTKLYEVFENKDNIYMILEYSDGGDLINLLKSIGLPDLKKVKLIAFQVLKGLKYLKSNKIIHRDIKLDNILCDKEHKVFKICDFGISTTYRNDKPIFDTPGTPAYLAPEVIKKEGDVGYNTDIWSLGILIFSLIFGDFPFNHKDPQIIYKKIYKGVWDFPFDIQRDEGLLDLITKMLEYNIYNRPSVDKLLKEDIFKDLAIISNKEDLNITYDNQEINELIYKYLSTYGIKPSDMHNIIEDNHKNYFSTFYYLIYNKIHKVFSFTN